MGAGSFGAGVGGAGTYVPSGSNASAITTPRALKLNPLTRDFMRDEDGQFISCHPVEHRAMMLLIPALATIRSATAQGGRWRELVIDNEEVMTARLREMVLEAWRPLLAAGDIRVDRIASRPQNAWGRGRIEIVWVNLRDPEDPNRRITTSL